MMSRRILGRRAWPVAFASGLALACLAGCGGSTEEVDDATVTVQEPGGAIIEDAPPLDAAPGEAGPPAEIAEDATAPPAGTTTP